jgi:hypothetical protein
MRGSVHASAPEPSQGWSKGRSSGGHERNLLHPSQIAVPSVDADRNQLHASKTARMVGRCSFRSSDRAIGRTAKRPTFGADANRPAWVRSSRFHGKL